MAGLDQQKCLDLSKLSQRELTKALSEPINWIGSNAAQIKSYVIKAGGWIRVFPMDLPPWAHRNRQMFNEEPKTLHAVNSYEAGEIINRVRKSGDMQARFAPSGSVYVEYRAKAPGGYGRSLRRYWIEQSQAGTKYHDSTGRAADKVLGTRGGDIYHTVFAALTTHHFTDVFKMCLADGTGGSSETCVYNDKQTWNLGKEGKPVQVIPVVVTNPDTRGSYNFADTMVSGSDAHGRLDVKPDNAWGAKYVKVDTFSSLESRIFKERDMG